MRIEGRSRYRKKGGRRVSNDRGMIGGEGTRRWGWRLWGERRGGGEGEKGKNGKIGRLTCRANLR